MKKISVSSTFSVRFASGKKLRVFTPGVHELSEEELGNWFVQGCIREGRAAVLPDDADETGLSEDKLRSMTVSSLKKMAAEMGIEVQGSPKKDALVAMILEADQAEEGDQDPDGDKGDDTDAPAGPADLDGEAKTEPEED
ncbi:Rho termination factor N-terminal domain-containing protein [Desulfobulbus propionicus]